MGCGTSKPSNVVSPVPNTQTALPKGSKDSLPGKPQGSKNVDIIVVKQAGRQDTHGTHKPLKENTKRIEAADTKQDQFVRSNSVKVGSQQVVPRASNDFSATSNESNQHHVVVRKSLGDVIPLKENEAALISEEVKYEDSSEIPRGSATPSDHGAMQTELPSSEFKAVLTETPRETTAPIQKRSSLNIIQGETETSTPISGSSLLKLIQEKLKTEVTEADETSTTTTIFPQIVCPPTTPVESKDFTEDLKQTLTQLVTLAEIENGQQDNYVTEEIPQENQSSVTMETDRGDSKESQSSVTMEIHRGVSKESQSNVTIKTDIANGKEIVTIRIEVDDELEPELQNETVVPVKGRCAGHESSLSQLACELGVCEVESTSSSNRYFPTKSDCTVRSKLTLPTVSDVVISTSDSRVDNVCRSPSLRIEKHMNEELDVYPSPMRALSPSCLSVARSVMSTSLTELKEEEEEDDNKIEQGEE